MCSSPARVERLSAPLWCGVSSRKVPARLEEACLGEKLVPSCPLVPWEGLGCRPLPLAASPCPSPRRVDANAHKKNLILKSCQGADLIEVLHYHSCDSRSPPTSEYVKCLLNLQVQHVRARFAVYLTGKDKLRAPLPLPSAPGVPPKKLCGTVQCRWRGDKKLPLGETSFFFLLPFLPESLI